MSYHWAEVTLFVSIKKKSDADNSLTVRYDGQIHLAIVRNTVTVETIGEFSLFLSLPLHSSLSPSLSFIRAMIFMIVLIDTFHYWSRAEIATIGSLKTEQNRSARSSKFDSLNDSIHFGISINSPISSARIRLDVIC